MNGATAEERKDNIEDKVIGILAAHAEKDPGVISLDDALEADMGFDDLDMVELVFSLEIAFGLSIPEEDEKRLITGRDIVGYIQERL